MLLNQSERRIFRKVTKDYPIPKTNKLRYCQAIRAVRFGIQMAEIEFERINNG